MEEKAGGWDVHIIAELVTSKLKLGLKETGGGKSQLMSFQTNL